MEGGVLAGVVLAGVVGGAVVLGILVYVFHRCTTPTTHPKNKQEEIPLPHATGTLSSTYKSFRDSSLDVVDGGNPGPYYHPPPIEPVPVLRIPPSYQQVPNQYHLPQQNRRYSLKEQQLEGWQETPSTVKGYRQYRPSLADITDPFNHANGSTQNHNNHPLQYNRRESVMKDELEGWGETPNTVKGYRQYRPSLADITFPGNDMVGAKQSHYKVPSQRPHISRTTSMPVGQQRPWQQQRQTQRQGQGNKEELLYFRLTAPTNYRKSAEEYRNAGPQNFPRLHYRPETEHPDPAMVNQNYWI